MKIGHAISVEWKDIFLQTSANVLFLFSGIGSGLIKTFFKAAVQCQSHL